MKKANNKEIAKLFGYSHTAFTKWKHEPELKTRFDALKTIATLEKNGVGWRNIEVILADKDAKIQAYETKFKNAKAYLNEQLAEIDKRGSKD